MLNTPEDLPEVTEMSTSLDDIRDTDEAQAMLTSVQDIEALSAVECNNWAYSTFTA